MRKLVLFMHVSLDGFVAGLNGEMEWIKIDDEMFDYVGERTNISDMALYGRVTYQMMDAYWPTAADQPNASKHDIEHSAWYSKVEKIVVSRSMKGKQIPKTKIISDDVANEVARLKQTGSKEILVFGSPSTGHVLTQANLIDEFWLFVNPMILGEGIPLFKGLKRNELKLLKTHVFKSGVVCLHYQNA